MSSQEYDQSIWDRQPENSDTAPRYCPHCGGELAAPQNLWENDDVDVSGRSEAYRRHRQTHFGWGDDPSEGHDGDPYLDDYYDDIDGSDDDGPALDPDEEVAGVYEVEINYDAVMRARVVAATEGDARERAKNLRIDGDECVGGWVPEATITHAVHETAREVKSLTRGEIDESSEIDEDEGEGINFADRLPGWPW